MTDVIAVPSTPQPVKLDNTSVDLAKAPVKADKPPRKPFNDNPTIADMLSDVEESDTDDEDLFLSFKKDDVVISSESEDSEDSESEDSDSDSEGETMVVTKLAQKVVPATPVKPETETATVVPETPPTPPVFNVEQLLSGTDSKERLTKLKARISALEAEDAVLSAAQKKAEADLIRARAASSCAKMRSQKCKQELLSARATFANSTDGLKAKFSAALAELGLTVTITPTVAAPAAAAPVKPAVATAEPVPKVTKPATKTATKAAKKVTKKVTKKKKKKSKSKSAVDTNNRALGQQRRRESEARMKPFLEMDDREISNKIATLSREGSPDARTLRRLYEAKLQRDSDTGSLKRPAPSSPTPTAKRAKV